MPKEYNYHQEALLQHEATLELSKMTGLEPKDVLDIVLPGWRKIREWEYGEAITWGQARKLWGEVEKSRGVT